MFAATQMVYLLPFFSYLAAPKAFPPVRLSDSYSTTNTALIATLRRAAKKQTIMRFSRSHLTLHITDRGADGSNHTQNTGRATKPFTFRGKINWARRRTGDKPHPLGKLCDRCKFA